MQAAVIWAVLSVAGRLTGAKMPLPEVVNIIETERVR